MTYMSSSSTEMAFFPPNFMLQISHDQDHHPILPPCSSQDHLHGVASFLGMKRSSMSFMNEACDHEIQTTSNGVLDQDETLSEDGSLLLVGGEKKRRLNMEQVKTLEKNFELGNKLEPERKMQLARALGLQPRQIAIWFQNRRARWKTKQLEKDYEILKKQFDALKADNHNLQSQNHKLQAEYKLLLKAAGSREPTESINLNKETDQGSCSNRSDMNSSDDVVVKLDINSSRRAGGAGAGSNMSCSRAAVAVVAHQLFEISSPAASSVRPELHFQKLESSNNNVVDVQSSTVKEESFCNMFCAGIDDQPVFWPWLDQHQHFN